MARPSSLFTSFGQFASSTWTSYRSLAIWLQVVIGVAVVAIPIGGVYVFSNPASAPATETTLPTVTLERVDALAGNGSSVAVIGSVRSITEAEVVAQSGGTVTAVHTRLGAGVYAGSIIAELDNAAQRAAVLQAEGSYDAAIAARTGASPIDIAASARNTYATAYSTLDSLLKSYIDEFYGVPLSLGPQFLISPAPFDAGHFQIQRRELGDLMNVWRDHSATASTTDPQKLLDEAMTAVRRADALANDIAEAATKKGTDATDTQLAALATGRSGITSLQASITAAKQTYQGQSTSATAGADASVKIALGSLRAAQAQLEKTLVRAPIAGTINFLPIRVGDYVTALTHVATVAQNGALEILAYVSEENRALLSVGMKVMVEDIYPAVITSIAPALDPVTKQIEVRLTLTAKSPLLNGQSVRVALPSTVAASATVSGPLLLPLTALKLTPSARIVFSVGDEGRLVAHAVEIGDVHGDRIEIKTPLAPDLRIVTDARGLSEGQKVNVASAP